MDRYFQRISEIIEKKKISSRIKFMLQDVQDLRKVVPLSKVLLPERRRRVIVVSSSVCVLPLDLSNCKVLQTFEDMFRKLMQ